MSALKQKAVLVLGGTGSIGTEIIKQLLAQDTREIRVFARDESKHQYLYDTLGRPKAFKSLIGDIRDKNRLHIAMEDIDIVFNAAAMKAVPYCEKNPIEAINTNVIGTNNIVEVALEKNIEKVVLVSTDKAADPTNAYGTTKLLSERIMIAADYNKGSKRTIFSAVRLGNVLGARNSVLPVIKNQILSKQPITITDSNMTRFVMTASEAVNLVFNAYSLSQGGEVFVSKMHALRIWDLIDVYIQELSKVLTIDPSSVVRHSMPPRPGEKLHEKLFSDYEGLHTFANKDMLMILPSTEMAAKPLDQREYLGFEKEVSLTEFDSETAVKFSKEEIKALLHKEQLV